MRAQEAQVLLRTIDEGLQFYFCNGRTARNLKELLRGMLTLNSEQYRKYVYFDHNDFSNWLLDVIGDDKLARDIFAAEQRKAIALTKARIYYLEEHART